MLSIRRKLQAIAVYVLPALGGLILFAALVDVSLYNSTVFVQSVLTTAEDNDSALSVIISGLLLFAYMLQFQSQHFQRKIMSRQETLMKAGFTPILGVTHHEFGNDASSERSIPNENNRLYIDIINNGNATARDLRMWFGISYNGVSSISPLIRSNEVKLTREEEGSWWPTDTGEALSNSSDSATTFVCDPELKHRQKSWYLPKLFNNYEPIPVHQALNELDEIECDEFRLAMVLRYRTTVGNSEEIRITSLKANPSKIGDNYLLRTAQDQGKVEDDYVRQAV